MNRDINKKDPIKYPKRFEESLPLNYKVINVRDSFYFVVPLVKGLHCFYSNISSNKLFFPNEVYTCTREEADLVTVIYKKIS